MMTRKTDQNLTSPDVGLTGVVSHVIMPHGLGRRTAHTGSADS